VDFHAALNKRLKDLFGMRGGGKGGSKNDWRVFMSKTPGAQKQALDAVLDAARKTDMKHGTEITKAVWESIIRGEFTVFP
jgi:hypothetical protein